MKSFNAMISGLLLLTSLALKAQETITASGGNASGADGAVSYTVGQMVYTTYSATSGCVAQGVQQPYEISVVTEIEEAKGINLMVSAYPNPTNDNLTLSIDKYDISDLSYQLYNIQGKLLHSEKIISNQTSIVMSTFAPATYFLKVTNGGEEVKTLEIIKY